MNQLRVRIQRFGSYEDPDKEWPPEFLECLSKKKLDDGGHQLKLIDVSIRTFPAEYDIEEIPSDGGMPTF